MSGGQLDKLVFLDIDGVMNNELYFAEYKQTGSGGRNIDPKNVGRLNRLIEETDAKIVISSVWRHSHTPEEMAECLVKRGFNYGGNVIANTPSFRHEGFSVPRGVEIDAYLHFRRHLINRSGVGESSKATWLFSKATYKRRG